MSIGLNKKTIAFVLSGKSATTNGTDGEQGFGFGLSLVKYLVNSMNGNMLITSEIGKASTFKLSLPQCK